MIKETASISLLSGYHLKALISLSKCVAAELLRPARATSSFGSFVKTFKVLKRRMLQQEADLERMKAMKCLKMVV